MAAFNDNFSKQASIYVQFRPSYPHELFDYLQSLTPQHELAWDCGTGNGQSAIHLAEFYKKVFASDPSEAQIQNAFSHDQVVYRVEKAEEPSLASRTVDLITVAQAIHWFEIEKFYESAKRVLKKDGIIAVWAYGIPQVNKEIDKITQDFHDKTVGPFWQPQNKLIAQGYTTIPFPFREIEPPEFYIRKRFRLDDLLGHLRSWSATQKFIDQEQIDPLDDLKQQLSAYWKDPNEIKNVSWKIAIRVGKLAG